MVVISPAVHLRNRSPIRRQAHEFDPLSRYFLKSTAPYGEDQIELLYPPIKTSPLFDRDQAKSEQEQDPPQRPNLVGAGVTSSDSGEEKSMMSPVLSSRATSTKESRSIEIDDSGSDDSPDPETIPAPSPAKSWFKCPVDETAWTTEKWAAIQARTIKDANEPTDAAKFVDSDFMRSLKDENVVLEKGIWCFKPNKTPYFRILVPECLKAFVIGCGHNLPLAGHCGARKVIRNVSLHHYWRNMTRDIRRWVRCCGCCGQRKTSRPSTREALTPC